MSLDDRWRQTVLATLRAADPAEIPAPSVAATAIARGTARVAARARTRVALGSALVMGALALAAWQWFEREDLRAVEASLRGELLWIP